MIVSGIAWGDVSGGNLLVVAAIVGLAFTWFKASPIGSDAVRTWRDIAEGVEVKLAEAQADAQRRFEEREREKERAHDLEIQLAQEKAKPSVDQIVALIRQMKFEFEEHRRDLVEAVNQLVESEKVSSRREVDMQAILASMHQALIVLVDRQRYRRNGDPPEEQGGHDPPLAS